MEGLHITAFVNKGTEGIPFGTLEFSDGKVMGYSPSQDPDTGSWSSGLYVRGTSSSGVTTEHWAVAREWAASRQE